MACQNNKHLVNTLLLLNIFRCWPPASLELGIFVYTHFTEIFTFLHGPAVHLCGFTCVDSIQHLQHSNCGSTPTNVTFSCQSLSCKHMHTCNTLLHREPCCVLSGGTQMAATWCVLMGSCDGFGQDMDTHTQMVTHWEWTGDGRADYWFAQINDSQPGHLTLGELHPQSWHTGLAHLAHISASMQSTSQWNSFQ